MEAQELTIEEEPTDSLVPYAHNAKLHPELQVEQIAESIREFGFNDPIAVWTNSDGESEIIEGHGRVLAAKKLGMETVPVIHLDRLTDEQRRAYTHVHNQLTMNSGWDFETLDKELAELDFDFSDFGFDLDASTELGGDNQDDGLDEKYSDNIGKVDYEPKDSHWKPEDLYEFDREDVKDLISGVKDVELRKMMYMRLDWLVEFKYARIADYYAYQATPDEQRVFEALGLVLLDRDQMIQNGFADLVEGL